MSKETSNNKEKKSKIPLREICEDYADLINYEESHNKGILAFKDHYKKKFYPVELGAGIYGVVEELDGKVIRHTRSSAVVKALTQFSKIIPNVLQEYKLTANKYSEVAAHWENSTDSFPLENVKPVLQKSAPGYCFHRLDFDMCEQETPLFDDLLDHIETNKDAFLAYLGMLFDPTAPRQQYLWIHGEGGDGKGAITRFLKRLFGPSYVALQTHERMINQFYTSRMVGMRVGVFQDCHSPNFVQSEMFMMLSGGDPMYIEPKGLPGYTDDIPTMFIFASNDLPRITGSEAHMRRAVICTMRKRKYYNGSKLTYEDRLWGERAGILHKCWQMWVKHKAEDGCVIAEQDIVREVASSTEEKWESIFHEFFTVTDDDNIGLKANIFSRVLQINARMLDPEISNFKKFIARKYNIKHIQHRAGEFRGQRFYLRCGLNPKIAEQFSDDNMPAKF